MTFPRPPIGRVAVGALAALALGAAVLPATAGATGELTYLGCFANGGANGCGNISHASLTSPVSVAATPDGRSVYAVSLVDNSITAFTRDPITGLLGYQGCTANNGAHGCADPPMDSLDFPEAVAVSPDNKSVYVASSSGRSVTEFSRDLTTGSISFESCIANAGLNGCVDPSQDSLAGADGIAVSPDGASVYVAAADNDSIAHFTRSPSGAIFYQGCLGNTTLAGCVAAPQGSLSHPRGVAVSPDNKSVYVTSSQSASLTHLTRNPDNGFIGYQGCIASGGGGVGCIDPPHDSLNGAQAVAVSPDDKSVYVASGSGRSITRFNRDPSNGFVFYGGCIADGGLNGCIDPPHDSLAGAEGVAVSSDGKSVYVASFMAQSITQLARDTADGSIAYGGCIANGGLNGCVDPPMDSLNDADGVAVTADGKSVYVAAGLASVTELARHTADCAGKAATIVGTKSADTITGTPGADVIAALGGNDSVSGLGGKDVICGAGGKDKLRGQAGADKLLGGPGKDKVRGGPGRDELLGQGGADLLVGGPGRDKLRGGPGRDRVRQ